MSGRPTADIMADLREWIGYMEQARLEDSVQIGTADQVLANMRDAVARLAELDVEVTSLQTSLNETLAELFTPPSTAVVRGDVIYVNKAADVMARLTDVYRYLREQKRGLDALTVIEARNAIEIFDEIDALRPPCPTCGGTFESDNPALANDNEHVEAVLRETYRRLVVPCPDCIDGKVPIERLIKVFEAVWAAVMAPDNTGILLASGESMSEATSLLDHLRGVR